MSLSDVNKISFSMLVNRNFLIIKIKEKMKLVKEIIGLKTWIVINKINNFSLTFYEKKKKFLILLYKLITS